MILVKLFKIFFSRYDLYCLRLTSKTFFSKCVLRIEILIIGQAFVRNQLARHKCVCVCSVYFERVYIKKMRYLGSNIVV